MKALALILVVLTFVTGAPARAADGIALIIGSNEYLHAPKLKNARGDAERIAAVMKGIGFEVIALFDANRAEINAAMEEFAEKAKTSRIALVYYAGHGIQHQGSVYLVPVDVDLGDERDLRNTIPADYLVSDASRASELGVIILDACRDNPFVKQLAENLGPTRSMSVNRGLTRIDTVPTKSLIAYATQAGNVALDGEGGNSPYAEALAANLVTPNKDIRLIFGAVRDEVVKATDGKQEPFIYGSLGGSEIYLATVSAGSGDSPAPAQQLVSLDIPNVAELGSLPADYVAWKRALKADAWPSFMEVAAARTDGLYAVVAEALAPFQSTYTRPSEALVAGTGTAIALSRLSNSAIAAIQTALRDLDYYGATVDGEAGPRTAKALAAFAETEAGGGELTLGMLVTLAERAASRAPASSLTGAWKGRYDYPDDRPGVDFTQELTFSLGRVTGFVSEPNTFGDSTSKNLYAVFDGSVAGNEIEWVKTYDGTGGISHSVNYRGTLDRNAKKITGRWSIEGSWNGPFELTLQ